MYSVLTDPEILASARVYTRAIWDSVAPEGLTITADDLRHLFSDP